MEMLRKLWAADDSFAAILDRMKLGMAIAEMIRITQTTISSSISEKPLLEEPSLDDVEPLVSVLMI